MALTRTDPDYPALQLANLIFGGYFSSRWVENLREDKGYTYGPHSRIDHQVLGSILMLDAEVATEVTAPSLLETNYELGKMATLPVTQHEVESVRQYAIGSLALSTATQTGLASTLSALSAFGLGLDWVIDHPARLQQVTVDDVSAAAAEYLAPSQFTTVVVGDAATVADRLAVLGRSRHDRRSAARRGTATTGRPCIARTTRGWPTRGSAAASWQSRRRRRCRRTAPDGWSSVARARSRAECRVASSV